MSSTTEFDEAQLAAARAKAWRQDGDSLLTLEATRDWINSYGLVLFSPRPAQLPAPAPSLVEATLGAANAAPTMAETEAARSLVSRLVGEGLALPLNLLGVPGDSPDFVVSAQLFSYVFTLRGDKAWKQPPSTSGAVRVSPLGLRVFEVLTERGPMSAAELALELGREVTEAAILRSLTELWSQLRVIPLLEMSGGVTLWELTSRRFTKAIKAGANAGLPKALSAVVSLYLAQVFGATEDEITTFLSPLTARSRVREVVHALLGARQLETVVVEGKTLLHIPGGLPVAAGVAMDAAAVEGEAAPAVIERPKKVGTGRISKFGEGSERKPAGEFRGKPAAGARTGRPAFGAKPAGKFGAKPAGKFGAKPAGKFGAKPGGKFAKPAAKYGPRLDGKTDPERRPFKKDTGGKPSFSKPWDEDKKPRAPRAAPDAFTKYRKPEPEDRAPLGAREQAGLPPEKRSAPKSTRSFDRAPSKPGGFAKRPYTPRGEGAERPAFQPRSYEKFAGGAERPAGGAKPRSFSAGAAKPGGFAAKRPYTPRAAEGGGERPYPKKPYTPRASAGGGEKSFAKRPYAPRASADGERPAPRPYAARSSEGSFPKRAYTPRPPAGETRSFTKRPFTPRTEDSGERSFPKRPYKPRAADADQRKFTKAPWTPPADDGGGAAKRSSKPRFGGAGARKSFGGKSAGKFGGKGGGAKPFVRKKPGAQE